MSGIPYGFKEYVDPLTGFSLKEGDPMLDWINDWNILRMFGVGQLGLSRKAPENNPWSRGRHSVSTAFLGMAIAESAGLSKDDQRKVFVMGRSHDAHPAGGDGMKLALGVDEASVSHDYWFTGAPLLRFKRGCREMGWDWEQMQVETMNMILRKDTSISGRLIHNPNRNVADADFISYTMADLAWGSARQGLNRGSRNCLDSKNIGNCIVAKDLVALALELDLSWWETDSGGERPHHSYSFSYDDFNPVGKMIWDSKRESWVFTDSEVLHHLIVASAILHFSLYFHPGVQGPELMLKRGIEKLGISKELGAVAMASDDADLREALTETGLGFWLTDEAHRNWEYREAGSPGSENDGEFRFKIPKFNLRLDTPVMMNGEIMPFRRARPDSLKFTEMVRLRSGREMLLVDKDWSKRPIH